MPTSAWVRISALLLMVLLGISRSVDLSAAIDDYDISQSPLFIGSSQPPLMMLVMSRDEQLFNKAYPDFTDLDGNGTLDTGYQDTFNYSGYFDPKLCYTGGTSTTSPFKASRPATGTNLHTCGGTNEWSGNFLNWVTMSRLDVLRFVLYGGQRVTDTSSKTVLERADVPNDLHAWVKVHDGTNIRNFTPFSNGTARSFCNGTFGAGAVPQMRVASGAWPEWAATALNQCDNPRTSEGKEDIPTANTKYYVQVEVCDPAAAAANREKFCKQYGTSSYKPVGLLQKYGESGRLRFGLVSGSFSNPRSGGVLRRSIGKFAGNGTGTDCVAGDEVNLSTGQFCNQSSGTQGIVNTLSRFKLTQWNYSSTWNDCPTYSILNRQGYGSQNLNNPGTSGNSQNCSAWGNPLAEMYAEALRYIGGSTGATTGFTGNDLTGLPVLTNWDGMDPYRSPKDGGNSYCASCSILVLSSGLASFDSDEIPTGLPTGIGNPTQATNSIGAAGMEGIDGGSYFAGRITATPLGTQLNTHEDLCRGYTISALGDVRGICPDSPSVEGSYLMAGMAYKAFTEDLRPGLQGKNDGHKNNVKTYAVALAENLPKFEIPVGNKSISLAPLCQANNSGSAKIADGGWRSCFLGSVSVGIKTSAVSPKHVYGRPLLSDRSAGSFSFVWEDSLWGNDHDNDVVTMLTYCVGAACNFKQYHDTTRDICWRVTGTVNGSNCNTVNVANDEVLVRVEHMSAYAGNAMLSGYTVGGTTNDGTKREILRPGNNNGSVLTTSVDPPTSWDKPKVLKFKVGTSGTKLLESPLWYAAKYGGFDDINDNGKPDAGEWDKRNPGQPDGYFLARDPSQLETELDRIFSDAAGSNATTAGGGAGARISTGSFTIDASFNLPEGTNDWTGDVKALKVKTDGGEGDQIWSATAKLPAAGSREVFTVKTPTLTKSDGTVIAATKVPFAVGTGTSGLGSDTQTQTALGIPNPTSPPVWFSTYTGADLIAYLKGDSSKEVRNSGKLRNRTSALGDIINSTTEVVSPRDDFGYGYWDSPVATGWRSTLGKGYKKFLTDKAGATPMVYVGANDGMLHGFEATEKSTGGTEHVAFVPLAVQKNLYQLADPAYMHRYYMDGPVVSSDVSFSATGTDWRTVLVGAAGAGGRSVFALDVTSPESFDQNDVLWELAAGTGTNYERDLGYVMGKPSIVAIKGSGGAPRWVALFGNGANSENGAPVLYAVDVKTGAVIARVKPSASAYAVKNGLMNIAPIAFKNSDGLADTVYGGDLQGNIWKFDISDEDPAKWTVAFGNAPMFTAKAGGVAQPITGGIEVSAGPGGGVSVFFGTGRYFVEGDNKVGASPPVQSLYGVWDDMSDTPIGSRETALVEQTIAAGTTSNGYQTRNVSHNVVSYAVAKGWYVDLVVNDSPAGERFIGYPRLQNGKVFFTSFEPGDGDCAAGGGINWLYGLELLTGAGSMSGVTTAPNGNPVCTGDCGALALNDQKNASAPVRDASIFVPKLEEATCDPKTDPTCLKKKLDAEKCTFVLRAVGADPLYLPRPCGRQSWRQVR